MESAETNEEIGNNAVKEHRMLDQMLQEHDEEELEDEEKYRENRYFQLSNRFINSIMVSIAGVHFSLFNYDSLYPYKIFEFSVIIIVLYFLESKIETLLKTKKHELRQVLIYLKSVMEFLIIYFSFLVITLFITQFKSHIDDSQWSYSKIILPSIPILFILAIPLIVNLQFYQPIDIASTLRTETKSIILNKIKTSSHQDNQLISELSALKQKLEMQQTQIQHMETQISSFYSVKQPQSTQHYDNKNGSYNFL